MGADEVARLLNLYPRIYFACHLRHVVDPATRKRLSAHQASILDHLDAVDGITLGDLAGHLGVTPGTMSVHVDRLVRKGYVDRRRDPRDGRRAQLRITPAGLRVREASSVLDPALVARLLSAMTPAQREAGLRGLALLAEAADRSSREAAPRRKR
jgi:DNA-binding MarR family transcriptional regulator